MKRSYTKPYIAVESFQLNAAVAASCSSQGAIAIHYGENSCSYNGQYFNYDNCSVDLTGPEGDGNDTTCYHGPVAAGGVTFISS